MRLSFLLLGCLLVLQSMSQTYSGIPAINKTNFVPAPVSPEAQRFQQYTDVPVSIPSGVPQISVPVYTIQLKNFSWDVNLSYHAGGIRVADVAGTTGLGWTLNYGGLISMKMMGLFDLKYTNNANTLRRDLNLLTSHQNATATCTYSSSSDIQTAEFASDTYNQNYLPDIYYLNAGGLNTKFFLNSEGSLSTMPASRVKITYQLISNSPDTDVKWTVVDEQGNKYYFEKYGGTYTDMSYCGGSLTGSNSYYLTKITTFYGEEIVFNYTSVTYSYQTTEHEEKYVKPTFSNTDPCSGVPSTTGDGMLPTNKTCPVSVSTTERLIESIVASNGVRLVFNYSTRNDIASARKLDKVQVYSDVGANGQLRKTVQMHYGYFGVGTTASDLRLRLNAVSYTDGTVAEYKYGFKYNSLELPNRLSKSIDGGGFYNGAGNASLIPPIANRASSLTYTKACVLEKVIYPTGGFVLYDYELNDYRGGLRLKKSELYAEPTSTAIVKTYSYEQPQFTGYSFEQEYTIFFVKYMTDTQIAELIQCNFLKYTSEPNGESPYADASVTYGKVTEFNGVNGANGKIEYLFSTSDDLMQSFDIVNCGSPLKKKIIYAYDASTASFTTKRVEENTYSVIKDDSVGYYASSSYSNEKRTWGLPVTFVHDEYTYAAQVGSYCYPKLLLQGRLRLISAPMLLVQTKVKEYEGSNMAETVTDYAYGSGYYLKPVAITQINSKGQQVQAKLYYPDYLPTLSSYGVSTAETNAYTTLTQQNYFESIAIERYVASNLKEKKITTFSYNSATVPFVYRELLFSGSTITVQTEISKVDAAGNIEEVKTPDGLTSAYIWGYLGNYIIAEVQNAAAADIAFTSFEDAAAGTWSYTGTPQAESSAPTGRKAYNLGQSSGNIQVALNSSKEYIVSYWLKNSSGSVSVNSISATQKVTKNGWTLYEVIIPTSATSITISGTGTIDELRLQPKGSLMQTFTYDPFIGLTSKCDANGRVQYYEYDIFNRLKLVRDQDRNIVRRICYNYAGQTSLCGAYQNAVMSQSFQKNNCGTGYVGSGITYTVPAGKYTGDTQAEADAMAQSEITEFGQDYANNNGTCTVVCTTSNCVGANKKCLEGICETGVRIYTSSVQISTHLWECTYHYEWSDGSWSQNYTEESTTQCFNEIE